MSDRFEEDRHLLSRCFAGAKDARETFVRRYSNLVYQTVAHTLGSRRIHFSTFDLEDFHNTVFLHFFDSECKKLRQYQGRNHCSLATWIKVVTIHMVLDHLRKRGVDNLAAQDKRIPVEEYFQLAARDSTPLEQLEAAEQKRLFEKAVRYLPPRDRLFVRLHYGRDVPIKELAEIMGLSESNAYTIKHRIAHKIQRHVEALLKNGAKM